MASNRTHRQNKRRNERGYVLLTLLLMMALLAIATAVVVPTIKFQIERDREEEMIHRGVQYSRAIRAYYKKFGRYPVKLEDLETTNNLKFLRKRYKDPVNCTNGKCEDFKLLHFGEVKMFGSAGIAGATNVADMNNPNAAALAAGLAGGLGQSSLGQSSLGQSASFGGSSGFGQSSLGGSSLGGSSGFGGSSSSGFGSNSFGSTNQQNGSSSGTDSSQNGSNASGSDSNSGNGSSNGSSGSANGQIIGGGPIVGVVSNAKCPPKPKDRCEGYREFNHKKKYSDWQFVYDPSTDRGGLLMTPNQPPIQGFGQNPNQQNGTNGTNGTSTGIGSSSGFSNGFGSGFGNSPGTQNNPNPSGGSGTSNPPSSTPQQQ